jgi:excisionase family DNA binding protein
VSGSSRAPEPGGAPPLATASRASTRLDGPLLRPDQAAALLAVKTSWVYDAVRTGRLPCLRIGRHIRFTRAMLEEWLTTR